MHLPLRSTDSARRLTDTVELLSAAGLFLAAVAAVISVASIVLDEAATSCHFRASDLSGLGSQRDLADRRRDHRAENSERQRLPRTGIGFAGAAFAATECVIQKRPSMKPGRRCTVPLSISGTGDGEA